MLEEGMALLLPYCPISSYYPLELTQYHPEEFLDPSSLSLRLPSLKASWEAKEAALLDPETTEPCEQAMPGG